MQKYFTHAQTRELTGIPKPTLDRWIREGVVKPKKSGPATSPLLYTPTQVLGLHLAWTYSTHLGLPVKTLGYLVQFFERLTLAKVRNQIADGRKYLLLDPIGRIELVAVENDNEIQVWMVNVDRQLERLTKKMKAIAPPQRSAHLVK